ncbi:MAG TPA: response regulator transcription factor [Thermomicrobiales bacterium]|jgi:DNA-binding NarL/FixJ family response regulator
MSKSTIRVLLIEDHDIFRQGVRLILEAQPEITVVGEARTGAEGLTYLADMGDVDVIITDLVLPDISGLDIVRRVKAMLDQVHVIILTLYADDEHIRGMIEAGADGYVMKQVAVEELIGAIHTVVRGETALTPLVARRMMNHLQSERGHEQRNSTLSNRERQILILLAQGLTSKEIAQQLGISVNTVDNHRARLLSKLGVSNTASAISLAVRQGLIPPLG